VAKPASGASRLDFHWMKKQNSTNKVSLGNIAKALNLSKATVCNVLRGHRGPSEKTRDRVLKAAQKMSYVPDAHLNTLMAQIQAAKTRDPLPIVWLNTHPEKNFWRKYAFSAPYLEGASARARQLGYYLEEMWCHESGLTNRRLAQIIYQRGIEAVIVAGEAKHLRLNWDQLACVSIGSNLMLPRLDRVEVDTFHNILLALKTIKRFGYRRIGTCFSEHFNHVTNYSAQAAFYHFQTTIPKSNRVSPLIYLGESGSARSIGIRQIADWLRQHEPDVIVCNTNSMWDFVKNAGYRVPEEVGIVHLSTDGDVNDWAGIHSNKRESGATAVERVVFLQQNHQFGIPALSKDIIIRGTWHNGRTLMVPKPK